MKFCPYCGAELIDGAVSFCSECGERLADRSQTEKNAKKSSKVSNASSAVNSRPDTDECTDEDIGYDGYYDDILPDDDAEVQQGIDKRLIRNIALLSAAVIFIIGLSILAIYFL